MLQRRLAIVISTLSLIAGLALPGLAQQTFSVDQTGPLPSPIPGASAYPIYVEPYINYGNNSGHRRHYGNGRGESASAGPSAPPMRRAPYAPRPMPT